MTFQVSGTRLIITLALIALGVVVGLVAQSHPGPNGGTLLAGLLIVAGIIIAGTAPRGTLQDDEERNR